MPPAAAPAGPSVADLQAKIEALEISVEKEREERNYFQLERDKVTQYWEITKNELAETKAALRNKERELEELEENHQVQIKVYKQKVKNLLAEHQKKITELKDENLVMLNQQAQEHKAKIEELEKAKRTLKHKLKDKQYSSEATLKSRQENHDKEITKIRQDYDRKAHELHIDYVQKTDALRREIELRRKNELAELQNRKDNYIDDLIASHKRAFEDIKGYYYDITQNNMALILSLKDNVETLKRTSASDARRMYEMNQNLNAALVPHEERKELVEKLEKELATFQKTKASLRHKEAQIKVLEEELKNEKWEHEVLEQRFAQVQQERDELYDKFVSTIHSVQQKTGFKNILLEGKLKAVSTELEVREAQLNEVLAASKLDPAALSRVTRSLEDVLESKNDAIRELQYELARVTKAHNDVIRVYESKMTEFGIPVEELGFRPLLATTSSGPGTAPANLVTG